MTAVEYLFEEILKLESEYYIGNIGRIDLRKKRLELFEQAKEMEKQQIIDAHFTAQKEDLQFWNEAKQEALEYYNETFKKTNK